MDFSVSTLTSDPKQANVQASTLRWTFQMDQWPVFAERVAATHVTTIRPWRTKLATPMPRPSDR